ncbi:MAG: universal stress protein [Gammaproteobacteria bacterium]
MLATDFSTRSDRALRRATLLARQHGATLVIVHVIDDDQPRPMIETERAVASDLLAELAATLKRVDGIACETAVMLGATASGIVDSAASVQPDLLVLGPHRRQALRDVFIGTTAERSIRAAPCPVLMAIAPPVADYRHALLGCDLSEASRRAVRRFVALDVARETQASILYVFDSLELRAATAHPLPPEQREHLLDHARAAAAAELARFTSGLGATPMTPIVRYQDVPVADVTLTTAREVDADLVVIGTRGRSGLGKLILGSVAEAVLRLADRDVLAIPPGDPG